MEGKRIDVQSLTKEQLVMILTNDPFNRDKKSMRKKTIAELIYLLVQLDGGKQFYDSGRNTHYHISKAKEIEKEYNKLDSQKKQRYQQYKDYNNLGNRHYIQDEKLLTLRKLQILDVIALGFERWEKVKVTNCCQRVRLQDWKDVGGFMVFFIFDGDKYGYSQIDVGTFYELYKEYRHQIPCVFQSNYIEFLKNGFKDKDVFYYNIFQCKCQSVSDNYLLKAYQQWEKDNSQNEKFLDRIYNHLYNNNLLEARFEVQPRKIVKKENQDENVSQSTIWDSIQKEEERQRNNQMEDIFLSEEDEEEKKEEEEQKSINQDLMMEEEIQETKQNLKKMNINEWIEDEDDHDLNNNLPESPKVPLGVKPTVSFQDPYLTKLQKSKQKGEEGQFKQEGLQYKQEDGQQDDVLKLQSLNDKKLINKKIKKKPFNFNDVEVYKVRRPSTKWDDQIMDLVELFEDCIDNVRDTFGNRAEDVLKFLDLRIVVLKCKSLLLSITLQKNGETDNFIQDVLNSVGAILNFDRRKDLMGMFNEIVEYLQQQKEISKSIFEPEF